MRKVIKIIAFVAVLIFVAIIYINYHFRYAYSKATKDFHPTTTKK
jgi:hypothetical protein